VGSCKMELCSPTRASCSEPEIELLRDDHTLTGQVALNVRSVQRHMVHEHSFISWN
jgi:hypothetical protein